MKKLKRILPYLLIFAFVVTVYLVYQFYWVGAARLAGNDGYYYLARAKLIVEQGLAAGNTQNYTPFTLWGMLNGDNTLIYVLLITPLALFADPIIAAKIFTSVLVGLIVVLFYFLVNKKIHNYVYSAIIVLGGFFVNIAFFLKFTELRALILGVALYFVSLYLILIYKKRYYLLAPIAFLYVYLHTSAYLMFMPIVLLFILQPSKNNLRKYGKMATYILIGMALAFVTFPANNFIQIYTTQVVIPLIYLSAPIAIDGGIENKGDWRTPDNLIVSNLFNILVLVIAVIIYWKNRKQKNLDPFQTTSFIVFGLMVLLDLMSRRFSEYMAPSAMLFCTLHIAEIKNSLITTRKFISSNKIIKISLGTILIVGGSFGAYKFYGRYLQNDVSNTNYKGDVKTVEPETWGVAKFIDQNIAKGEYIYDDAWEDFPALFYKAPNYKYAAGMEVGFMYLYDKDMLKFYQDFRNGKDLPDAQNIITQKFKAKYILLKLGKNETANLKSIKDSNVLYRDDYYLLSKINMRTLNLN